MISLQNRIMNFLGSIVCKIKGHDIDYCIGCNPNLIRMSEFGIMLVCMRCGTVTKYDPGCD
jgi:hypothetical protein